MALPYPYSEWVKMGQFVQLDDGKVFYVHKGQGFPVIMLHQYGGNSWVYSRVVDAFARHFSVYAVDMPGCAQSDIPPLPYGPPEYAEALKEFMDKLGIQRAHFVGCHGGSLNSAQISIRFPSRVAKLVMDGTPPWNRLEGKKYWREWMRPQWLDENERPKPVEQRGGAPGGGPSFPGLSDEERKAEIEQMDEDLKEHGMWWIASTKEALKFDLYTRLHLIQAPTLVVNGETEWGRRSEYRLLNGIVGSSLAVIPGAGTRPAFEQPEAYIKAVLPFLTTGPA